MKSKFQIAFSIGLAALVALPAATAQWYSYGSFEPDTSLDSASFMRTAPPSPGETKVYFNAYTTINAGGTSGVNPNVGAAGTQIESFGGEEHWAILGVWTDCNGDGYVGLAETAMREYPSRLLLDDARCPAVTSPPGSSASCWTNQNPCPPYPFTGWNNLGGWVTELIPIGGADATSGDRRVRVDPQAAVWGDYGQPDEDAAATDGGTCATTPLPRGTLQTTGGAITYLDCFGGTLGLIDVWNELWVDTQVVAGVGLPGAGDPLGVRFGHVDDGSSGSLGGFETLGDDHSDNAIVHAGDCSDPDAYEAAWPGGLPAAFYENFGGGIRPIDTSLNPEGNVAGTANYTLEALPLPTRESNNDVGPESTSNCDFSDDRGSDVYLLEGDFNSVLVTEKKESDWNFGFQTMTRGGAPLGVPFGLAGPAGFASGPVRGAPSDAGIEAFNAVCLVCQQSEWYGGSLLTNKLPQTITTRAPLEAIRSGEADPQIDGGYWLSFYAYVGPVTTSQAQIPGGLGAYGAGQCGEAVSGIRNGWQCDPALWYLSPDGTPLPDPYARNARPGALYNLRDVDCYDGSLGDTGVGIGLAYYGSDACT